MARLIQEMKVVPIIASADIVAGLDSDAFSLEHAHSVAIALGFGPSHGGAAGAIIKVYTGLALTDKTTAITFNYSYTSAIVGAANGDVWTANATSAALQIPTATIVSRVLMIQFDVVDLTAGHKYCIVEIGNESDAGELSGVAYLYGRYASMATVTVLA